MRIKLILLLLPLAILHSCSSKQAPVTHEPPLTPERSQVWQLVELQGRTLDRTKKAPTLSLNPDTKTASGTAYCNEYSFRYTLSHPHSTSDGDRYEAQFTYWGSGTTECPEGDMNAERRYLGLLGKTTSLTLTATTLTLYQKNRQSMHFELQ